MLLNISDYIVCFLEVELYMISELISFVEMTETAFLELILKISNLLLICLCNVTLSHCAFKLKGGPSKFGSLRLVACPFGQFTRQQSTSVLIATNLMQLIIMQGPNFYVSFVVF
jgi:hypothetical protein